VIMITVSLVYAFHNCMDVYHCGIETCA